MSLLAFDEPTTEEDADELQAFLEEGAETSIEILEESRAEVGLEIATSDTGIFEFGLTAQDLLAQLESLGGNQALLLLEGLRIDPSSLYVVHFFVNNPEPTRGVSIEDQTFLGAAAIFECEIDPTVRCDIPAGEPPDFRLDATRVLQRLAGDDRLQVSVLATTLHEDVPIDGGVVTIAGAVFQLVRSLVVSG